MSGAMDDIKISVKWNISLACRSGRVREVQKVLKSQERDPMYVEYCKVAMFEACRVGSVDIVEYLVCEPSLVNCTDKNGETPLHIASKFLDVELCEVIIQTGACHVNTRSIYGQTPLHLAIGAAKLKGAVEGQLEITRLLLSIPDCDPHIKDARGITPLQMAYQYKLDSIIIALLDKAFVEGYTKTEQMVQQAMALSDDRLLHLIVERYIKSEASILLLTAIRAEDCKAVEVLLNSHYCDPNVKTASIGDTPLITVCKNAALPIVHLLLSCEGCNINAQNYDGHTALHYAVAEHFSEAVILLTSHKMYEANLRNKLDKTPLHTACTYLNVLAVIKILINRVSDADVNLQSITGQTPLHLAVEAKSGKFNVKSKVEIIQLLLASPDSNPNIKNFKGETPLIIACKKVAKAQDYLPIIDVIMSSGKCDPNILDHDGFSALHCAAEGGCKQAVEVLCFSRTCKPHLTHSRDDVHVACSMLQKQSVQTRPVLGTCTCNVNLQTRDGRTPLHMVVGSKNGKSDFKPITIQLLLAIPNCDPNMKDGHGNTPLILASALANDNEAKYYMIRTLLSSDKCDPNIQNNYGNTALHIAVLHGCQRVVVGVLVCCERYHPDIPNWLGQTPLHIACSKLHLQTVEILLNLGMCDVNAQTRTHQTPLHLVLTASPKTELDVRKSIVCLLFEVSHCDPLITNDNDVTPLQIAYQKDKTLFQLILEKANAKGYSKTKEMMEQAKDLILNDLISKSEHKYQTFHLEAVMWQRGLKFHDCPGTLKRVEAPLIAAIKDEFVQAVKVLLDFQYFDPNVRSASSEETPLIIACTMAARRNTKGSFQILRLLLSNDRCDPNSQNNEGKTALHIAVAHKCREAMNALVGHKRSDLNVQNILGDTPLHIAVEVNASDILEVLLHNKQCDPNIQNKSGETPLHIACKQCKYECVVHLTKSKLCNINIPDTNGHTPLHKAIYVYTMLPDQTSIIEHLISDSRCDVTASDIQGDTALHIACRKAAWKHDESILVALIRLLLNSGKVNPQCVNDAGETPAQLAIFNRKVYQELYHFSETQLKHPIEMFVKVFVVGNAETGKSTLIEAICTEAPKGRKYVPSQFKTVKGVKLHTAGIVPIPVHSQHFGNAIIYDFAGQHEYYSSHAAVLENLVLSSPPVFVVLVDLSESFDEMSKIIAYWWSFIGSYTARTHLDTPPHVIVVGSHKDIVKARGQNVSMLATKLLKTTRGLPTNFIHAGFAALNCKLVASDGLTILLSLLKKTCETLRKDTHIDLRCHVLSAFLQDQFPNRMACTLADIIDCIKAEKHTLLPQSTPDLVNLLSTLSDKDRILLLKNQKQLERSWIILQRQRLYREVNGSIFAPEYFDEHLTDFARSTGVVPLSKIRKYFPQHHPDIITGFLSHLEFCFKISDAQTLELIADEEEYSPDEQFYFFPALVQVNNPPKEKVWKNEVQCPVNKPPQHKLKYGWFYECSHPHQYLMTRFLHVLLFRLAFLFALAVEHRPSHNYPVIRRKCSVWKRGIAWLNNHGIETVLEVGLQNQWVVLLIQCSPGMEVECAKLRSAVVKIILDTKEEFCPSIGMYESLLHPCNIDYPFHKPDQVSLYRLKEVSKVVVQRTPYAVDEEGLNSIPLMKLLPFEPYTGLGDVLITQLFTSGYAQQKITDLFLKELSQRMLSMCDTESPVERLKLLAQALQPQEATPFLITKGEYPIIQCVSLIQQAGIKTLQSLEEKLSSFSIFCGRNPLDLAGLPPAFPRVFTNPEHEPLLEQTDNGMLGIESLLEVRTQVAPAVGHSTSFGLALGLSQAPTLQVIQHNWPDDVAFQLTEIMAAWLQGMGNSSWRSLAKALLDPAVDCPTTAHAIMEHHPHHSHISDRSEDDLTYQEVDGAAPDESFPSDVLSAVVRGGHISWFHLGLVLGLHYGTLKAIQTKRSSHDYTECVADVITTWLKQVDSVGIQGQPSWRVLARALAHPLVGQHRLANDIARDHPAQEVANTWSLPEITNLTSAESHSFP